jgi:type IV secretory pathway VirB10-like protein
LLFSCKPFLQPLIRAAPVRGQEADQDVDTAACHVGQDLGRRLHSHSQVARAALVCARAHLSNCRSHAYPLKKAWKRKNALKPIANSEPGQRRLKQKTPAQSRPEQTRAENQEHFETHANSEPGQRRLKQKTPAQSRPEQSRPEQKIHKTWTSI